MPIVTQSLFILAPPDRVFDLSRSIEVHIASTASTGERAVGGVTSGLLELGDQVSWEARHLGIRQRLTSRITAFDRPSSFTDSMVSGAFARFDHHHRFRARDSGTLVEDVFDYTSPLGALGRLADAIFLERYMARFLRIRLHAIKAVAESDDWHRFLP